MLIPAVEPTVTQRLLKKLSKVKEVPPFVIFQDPSLEDMAIQYPITIDELQNISGVGAGKAQRYGKEFVEMTAVNMTHRLSETLNEALFHQPSIYVSSVTLCG